MKSLVFILIIILSLESCMTYYYSVPPRRIEYSKNQISDTTYKKQDMSEYEKMRYRQMAVNEGYFWLHYLIYPNIIK